MCAKTVSSETMKKGSGLRKGLEIRGLKDIGISSVKRSENIILGTNLKDVLKANKGVDVNN